MSSSDELRERRERVEERINVIERLGQHGTMPNYWREPLFLAFVADDVMVSVLSQTSTKESDA